MQPALSSKGAIPKTLNTNPNQSISGGNSGVLSIPNASRTAGMGLSVGNVQGLISKPDTTYTHTTTTTSPTGSTTVTKPSSNPSVLAQQQSLNQANKNTPGYVPLVEDGLAGPKTSAAIAQYGYNTQTGQPNIPKTITPTTTTQTPALTIAGQAPGVLASGAPTEYEKTTIGGLINQSQNESPEVTKARQDLVDFQRNLANTDKNISAQGISLDSARGQMANVGQAATSELAALQGGVTNALTSQGQQITAGTAANTGAQNQANRATGTAENVMGAVAPQLGQYGQTYYNPGQQNSGGQGGVQPNDPYYKTLQNYAQMAAQGQYGAIPSSVTSNPVLNDQMNQMAKSINPNYNPVTSSAQSAITTQQTGNVAGMTAAYKSAANLGSQLNDLITTFGINPNDVNAVNSGIQKVAQNVSSPQYKALNNLVTDLVSTYSSILTPGASTDTSRATAASLLDASAKGSSIMETLKNLDDQAKAKIAGQTTSYGETAGGNSGGGFSEGQTSSDGSLIYKNGKWTKA